MAKNYDLKKEWEKTKEQLLKIGKEATALAHKSEKEIVSFSKKSKLQIDKAAINLKKERLYYFIGKEYVKGKDPSKPSVKLQKLVKDLNDVKKEERALNKKLKVK